MVEKNVIARSFGKGFVGCCNISVEILEIAIFVARIWNTKIASLQSRKVVSKLEPQELPYDR